MTLLERHTHWLIQTARSLLSVNETVLLGERLLDVLLEQTQSERAAVILQDAAGTFSVTRMAYADGSQLTEMDPTIQSVSQHVLKEGATLLISPEHQGPQSPARKAYSTLRLHRMLCVPLRTETRVLGTLYADTREPKDMLLPLQVLDWFGDLAATALENTHRFERANNDPLTGLPNSSYFLLHVSKVLREVGTTRPAGVLLIDLDAFKRVNDLAGAESGDRALVDIAQSLQELLRTDGLVARYGSDKFAILLPPDEEKIALRLRDVAERARACIATKSYHGVAMSASIGGAAIVGSDPAISASDLVALADDALNTARSRGTGQVQID